jgi:ferric-dicitrate binding protein FerR (iron transport regulator)
MACAERARLWALSAGDVGPQERAALEAHLARCESCARELEAVRATRQVLILASAAVPSVDGRRFAPLPAPDRRAGTPYRLGLERRSPWALSALALAGAAAAAGALLVLRTPAGAPAGGLPQVLVVASDEGVVARVDGAPRALRAGASVPAGAHLKTPGRGRALLQLPDGSRVRVAASSELWLRRTADDEVALALERGRVAVLASHAARKQFVLEASGASVRVVGTAFSVELTERELVLAVAEGQVLLDSGNREPRLVGVGQRIALDPAGSATDRGRLGPSDEVDFRELGVPLPSHGASAHPSALTEMPLPKSPAPAAPSGPPVSPAPISSLPELAPAAPEPLRPLSAEELLLRRAEESIGRGDCSRFLERLSEYLEKPGDDVGREWARIMRARCLDDRHRAVEADAEYRRYLRDFPNGRWVAEARRAVAH